MKTAQIGEARKRMSEICEEFGLDYVICAGKVVDSKDESSRESAHLLFVVPHLERRGADPYIKYNWLWRTCMDIMTFARTMVDRIIDQHKLVSVPASELQAFQAHKKADSLKSSKKKVEDKASVGDDAKIVVPPGSGKPRSQASETEEAARESEGEAEEG